MKVAALYICCPTPSPRGRKSENASACNASLRKLRAQVPTHKGGAIGPPPDSLRERPRAEDPNKTQRHRGPYDANTACEQNRPKANGATVAVLPRPLSGPKDMYAFGLGLQRHPQAEIANELGNQPAHRTLKTRTCHNSYRRNALGPTEPAPEPKRRNLLSRNDYMALFRAMLPPLCMPCLASAKGCKPSGLGGHSTRNTPIQIPDAIPRPKTHVAEQMRPRATPTCPTCHMGWGGLRCAAGGPFGHTPCQFLTTRCKP